MRRPRRDMGGEIAVCHRFPDHPPVRRLPRADPFGKQRRPHRPRHADLTRQPIGAPGIGHQAYPGKGLNETGPFRRDHHIAGQRQIGPGPGSRPIDGGDHRQGAVGDGADQRHIFVVQHPFKIDRPHRLRVDQILTRAEGPPRPRRTSGQHDHPRLLRSAQQGRQQIGAQPCGQRVHHQRPVQGDRGDPLCQMVQHRQTGLGRFG